MGCPEDLFHAGFGVFQIIAGGNEDVARPTEEGFGEGLEIGDVGSLTLGVIDPGEEVLLKLGGIARKDNLGIDEGGGGDDEALGLEIAEPSLVIADIDVVGHYPVSGQM